MSRKMLGIPNIKFHKNLFGVSRIVTRGLIDGQHEFNISTFVSIHS
jgi:hypothetical protein